MSDGPHRSLPMRPWWKQAALRADKSAFDVSECTEAIEVALEREFAQLRPSFLKGLKDAHEEPGLFSPTESIHLQKLRPETPLEQRVLDNVTLLSPEEMAKAEALVAAFANAMRNEAPRFNKQIEEHYRRKSDAIHAGRERERLDEATARADVESLARRLLRSDGPRAAPALKKKAGLDDGVSL
ncbi:MAG: hypothetical protein IT176_01250 [Acidobacteria bacterium]|nr:hypothetical protein [Acidobacteriota bacterium]